MKLKHYLIASEENDYRPWILSTQALVLFCLIIWGFRVLLPAQITIAAPGIDPTDLMTRINFERTQRFIPALNTNTKLITAANGKAQDMLTRSYFAHVDPDGNYVWPRIEATGYTPYETLGENLAMDFTNAADVVTAWMNSPTHRENIENGKFQDQGLASLSGTFEPGHDTIMVVSLFGTLYTKAKTSTPAPVATTQTPPPAPKPTPTPKPLPTPTPTPAPAPTPVTPVQIYNDIKINSTTLSGKNMINVAVVISGAPTLVTAKLKSQSITLLPGTTLGEYVGSFTFDNSETFQNQTLTVEARDIANKKTSADFPVNFPSSISGSSATAAAPLSPESGPSSEAGVIKILRIVFGIFALIYLVFLIIDAIIIHRNKITRAGIHSNIHIVIFILIAGVSLFTNW